ncbi:MAG: hypothetical protein FJ027_08255 [Candidatus Rokubacteria bacterium]|nr:hypothetical protein [Candidatus Rokubacteria bacterium]
MTARVMMLAAGAMVLALLEAGCATLKDPALGSALPRLPDDRVKIAVDLREIVSP